ncbi:MAG: hypothetical protein LBP89_01695 [Helicobacteraceae bacterium]|jgi:hypothetical protein|nr:hypothetical protein [Helicobacteraceae bacterium]
MRGFIAYTVWYLVRRFFRILCSIIKRCYFIKQKRRQELIDRFEAKRGHLYLTIYQYIFATFSARQASAKEPKKYIFCRPRGGLNDILCQIAICIFYAINYRRVLYIDGTRSGFLDDLGRYFVCRAPTRERERERERELKPSASITLCETFACILIT